ncbi:MAG: ArsR/SmtB family transcription factor [Planctomycetota bacterium]
MTTLAAATDLMRLLGDPTRVRLLSLLAKEELTVAELTQVTRLTQSRVSTHLGKLREAGLVRDRRAGTSSYYRVTRKNMPVDARRLWEVVQVTARDPLLKQDAARLREVVRARSGGVSWADSVAGQMERHYSPGRTWEAALRGLLGLTRLGSVLDMASGDCAIAELVAPRARGVTCLDISATVLAAGRRRMAHLPHVSFRRGDMHALPFRDESFDHVLMLACLGYADDPARAVAEAARVLKPGGNVVAATLRKHDHKDVVAHYDHVQLGFDAGQLRQWFEAAGLTVELCDVTSREPRSPHFAVITVHASR